MRLFRRKCLPSILFGGLRIPVDRTMTHFALVGTTRSGKTTSLVLMMQDVLPQIGCNGTHGFPDGRALVFDPKTEFVPRMNGMGIPMERIWITHPFDRRGRRWDIAGEIETPTQAQSYAAVLVADREAREQFFIAAARDVLASVLTALHFTCPRRWQLRDVILVTQSPERLRQLLGRCALTQSVLASYGGDPRTLGNISATLRSHLGPLEPIAAAWHRASSCFRLTDWVNDHAILVLGHDESIRHAMMRINRCLIERATELALAPSQRDVDSDRTWMFLDEGRELGQVSECLKSLLIRGAGQGITVVLGFQSLEGLEEAFGERMAHEILAMCGSFAIFRLGPDVKTANWAADVLGKCEIVRYHKSFDSRNHDRYSESEHHQEQYVLRPEEFTTLPATNPANGLQGIFYTPQYGLINARDARITGKQLFHKLLNQPSTVARFESRPIADQILTPWNDDDLARLGFSLTSNENRESSTTSGMAPLRNVPRFALSPLQVDGNTSIPSTVSPNAQR